MKAKKAAKKTDGPLIKSANQFPVVGIGASAGGLDAFKKLLKAIPEDSGMAYVLVQHLDPTHESMLPDLLQRVTKIPVMEIADDIKVEPNHIYVIPSNKMMVATDGVLLLAPRPAKSKTERNLPIDLFFTSLAEVHQAHAIGVVLSGTASDGTQGLKAIKDHGGITFAQDEESAAYEGMPHSAAQAGVVDFILPPEKIPEKILEVVGIIKGNESDETEMPLSDVDVFKQILALLRIRKGVDFTYYKQPTIGRRILRRMALNKNEEPTAYLKYLRENKAEQDVLYQDLLIPVTSFFRDKKTFDNLCEAVFPHLVKTKTSSEPIRVWVAGCSTGEEAYSIAICLTEFLGNNQHTVQIFATDLSEPAIVKARYGVYTINELAAVSPQRLQEFFTKSNGSYQVNKNIRDMCLFAHHNFLKDPPFGKMDFISCRNVLIYMEPYLQKKALTTFHYALNPKGFLLLGKSETGGGVPDLFTPAAKNDKLFTRKDVPGRFMHVTSQRSEQNFSLADSNSNSETIRTDFQKTADDIMLRKYTPAGVVVNEAMDIVHFRGNTGNYLEQSPGKPSHNLLHMAKNGLAFELRNILHKAKKDKVAVIKENIPMELNGGLTNISIEAMPLPNVIEPHYLILFHDGDLFGNKKVTTGNKKLTTGKTRKNDQDLRIQLLEKELSQVREDMRSITEDQEAANEELQSANEELLSSSEELQSLNEELETGKEELQSTNEELTVVNQEMISLNEQLTVSRDYSEAIILNIHEPLLVLDKKLRIKTANDAFYKTFLVTELETEGSLIYNLGNRQWDIPELRTLLEKILPEKSKIKDFKVAHHFSSIGNRIMMLNAREVINKNSPEKLILLSIEDITEREKAQDIITKSGEYFRHLVKELPAAVYSCDAQGRITFYNEAAAKLWGRKPEIGKDQWSGSYKMFKPDGTPIPLETCPMAIAVKEGRAIMGEEVIIERPDGSRSNVFVHPQPEFNLSGQITGAINMGFDITELVTARKKVEVQNQLFNDMLMTAPGFVATLAGPDHVYELINEQYQSLFGQRKLQGKPLMVALPELEGQGFDKLLDKVYQTGEPYVGINIPITLARDEGLVPEERYFNFSYQPMYDEHKNIFSILIFGYEVTPQVIAAKKIEESEAFNRAVLESSPDCIKMLDAEGRIQFMNKNGICLLELDDFKSVENTYWWDMWKPENQQTIKDAVAKAVSGEKIQLQLFNPTAKGTPKWWDIIVLPVKSDGTDENVNKILSVSRDITEQKQNELKELELLSRFQNLVMQAPVAICVLRGKDYVIEVINEGMREMWDRKIEETINRPAFDVLPEFREQGLKELLDNVYNTGESLVVQELPLTIRRHGRMENIFVQFLYEPLREGDGTITGVMALAHEITEQVLARKKIEQSEKQFRQMAELMPQKIWTSDAEGNKDYFNKTLLEYAGLSTEELKGTGWQKIIHPEDWKKNKKQWEESISSGKHYEAENRLLRKDGKYLWHLTLAVPLKDDDGIVKMWVGSKTEIQEQRQLKEELERSVEKRTDELLEANKELRKKNQEVLETREKLMTEYSRSLIEASLDPLVTINLEGKITDMNQATINITGLTREELTGSNFFEYFTEPQEARKVHEKVFAKGSIVNSPLTLRHIDGKLTDILLNGSVYKDAMENVLGVVLVARDVTEQKRKATELTEAIIFAEMATQIAEEAKQTAELLTLTAEDAVKAKQQFLSNMSHEIRTPMNAIIGFTKVVLKTELTAKQREYLTAIKLSGNSLIVLINDILDLAKVDAGKMSFEEIPFKMSSSIAAMMHLFEAKVQEKNIALVKEYDDQIPEVLLGDSARLHQIILNLLSNAVKFTTTGKITVSLHLLNEDEKKVTIKFAVADTGIGIAHNKMDSVFEKFHQASSDTSRLYGGTGLGLTIVKQLVESQGGTIQLKSKMNKGSVFSFTLSFKKTDARVESDLEMLKLDTENTHIKVLVAEDIALNQLLMKTLLDDFGFERDIAANGKIAVEKMQEKDYDVILMDLQMPEMNGFEATDYIRNTLHSKIPIIALTADVTTVDLEKCKAVGMNDYIAKPVDEAILYSKIVGLVKKPLEKISTPPPTANKNIVDSKTRYTDLAYLIGITKYDVQLMMEMITLYLEQTPVLISALKKSLKDKDWDSLHAAAHKMLPSFAIMGIKKDYEIMTKTIQKYTGNATEAGLIRDLATQLEHVCTQACLELKEEYTTLKNTMA